MASGWAPASTMRPTAEWRNAWKVSPSSPARSTAGLNTRVRNVDRRSGPPSGATNTSSSGSGRPRRAKCSASMAARNGGTSNVRRGTSRPRTSPCLPLRHTFRLRPGYDGGNRCGRRIARDFAHQRRGSMAPNSRRHDSVFRARCRCPSPATRRDRQPEPKRGGVVSGDPGGLPCEKVQRSPRRGPNRSTRRMTTWTATAPGISSGGPIFNYVSLSALGPTRSLPGIAFPCPGSVLGTRCAPVGPTDGGR
jgi:hypothetical protein